jgi:diazepam-binding inhibitor (GABA receptor modulating acyl-CoA-binding protein)
MKAAQGMGRYDRGPQRGDRMATKKGSSVADKFHEAKARVEKLPKRPSNDQLLGLYALYKQATEGDVSGSRPGMLDLKGRAKHDAWAGREGLSKDDAMKKYAALVDKLEAELG